MKKLLLTLACTALLVGCVPNKQIERLGVITASGLDQLEDGWLLNTLVFFQFEPNAKEMTQITSSKAKTIKGARDSANLNTNYKLVAGQLRLNLFGKELAKQGLIRLLDTLIRDAKVADTMFLAVSDTTAQGVLQKQTGAPSPNIGNYLHQLIENNIEQEILPKSDLQDFMHKYYDIGVDPIHPLVTMKENKPVINHLALFKNDVYVGKITTEEAFFVKLLYENYKAGKLELALPVKPFKKYMHGQQDNYASEFIYLILSEIRSDSNVKLVNKQNLKYKADIKLEARLLEVSELISVESKSVKKELEKYIRINLEQQLTDLIKKLQGLNVDPIGFGLIYDQHTRKKELTDKEWRDRFPNITVDFNVDVEILRHGIFE